MQSAAPPEHNVTGRTSPTAATSATPARSSTSTPTSCAPGRTDSKDDSDWAVAQAETMLASAAEFGVVQTYSMCPPEDIPPLRQRFGDRLRFNGPISKKALDEPDDDGLPAARSLPGAGR